MKFRLLYRACFALTRNYSNTSLKTETMTKNSLLLNSGRFESDFFYRVLASRPDYVVGKTESFEIESKCLPLKKFLASTPSSIQNYVCTDLVNKVPNLSPDDVLATLSKLRSLILTVPVYAVIETTLTPLILALNEKAEALLKSERSLKVDFMLAELFYPIRRPLTTYNQTMLRRQSLALKYLSKADFVQHLFFANLVGSLEENTKQAVPIFLDRFLGELDVEEVGLICYSLFRCQYILPGGKLRTRIVNTIEDHQGEIDDLVMGVYAKYVRYMCPATRADSLYVEKFLNICTKKGSIWSLPTQMRLANVGSQAKICNIELLKNAHSCIMKNLNTCRVKDIAVSLYAHAFYDLQIPDNDRQEIIHRLQTLDVWAKHHQWLIRATLSLLILGHEDRDLLIRSLEGRRIDFTTTHKNNNFDTYALWTYCKYACPEMIGKEIRLPEEVFDSVRRKLRKSYGLAKGHSLFLNDIKNLIDTRFALKTERVQTLDLFVQDDIHVENEVVVVCHSHNCYSNISKLLGLKKFRVNLLKAAKYNVVEIHNHEFKDLTKNQQLQRLEQYLRKYIVL